MYGLVNRAIKDLIVSTRNTDTWNKIREKAGLVEEDFLDSASYPDKVTYDLVTAASEELNVPAEKILYDFGRHWILYTGREGWASLFYLGGDSIQEFLEGLDSMHSRVQIAMPNSNLPQFKVIEKSDNHLVLEYRSTREGLAPMVMGLLDGMAEKFNEAWVVEHVSKKADKGFDSFSLELVESEESSTSAAA